MGMDNVHRDYELSPDALRRVINFDILDTGKLILRKGFSLEVALAGCHSFHGEGTLDPIFYHDGSIKQLQPDHSVTTLGVFTAGLNRISYIDVNNDIYASCVTATGVIRNNQVKSWGLDIPDAGPTLEVYAGNLDPGTYHAVITYVDIDGRESGSSIVSSIELEEVGGISIIEMPIPSVAIVVKKRLYMTSANGETFFLVAELEPSDQFFVYENYISGMELRTQYLLPPPPSIGLAYTNGCIFGIDAEDPRVVWHTNPLDYDHVDKRSNYYFFSKPVTLIVGTRSGLYVCADKTYFIGNAGLSEDSRTDVFEYGGIAGTAQIIPKASSYIWLSPVGAVVGGEAGNASVLSEGAFYPGNLSNAAALFREFDGIKQYLVVGDNVEISPMQVKSDSLQAEYDPDYVLGITYNMNNGAPALYDGFAFNSFAIGKGGKAHYGLNAAGICILSGEDDDGEPINAVSTTGKDDQQDITIKTVPVIYVGAISSSVMKLTAIVDAHPPYTYDFDRKSEVIEPARLKPGKGLTGRYWQFELSNSDGAFMAVDSMDIPFVSTSRRV